MVAIPGVKGRKLNCIKRKSSDSPLFINVAFQKDIFERCLMAYTSAADTFSGVTSATLYNPPPTHFSAAAKMPSVFLDKRNWSSDFARFPASSDTLNSCITDSITWAEMVVLPKPYVSLCSVRKRDKISHISRTILVECIVAFLQILFALSSWRADFSISCLIASRISAVSYGWPGRTCFFHLMHFKGLFEYPAILL